MEQKRRWSSLPDDILNNIISRLNLLRDTVITISITNFTIQQSYYVYYKPTYNIYEYWTILDNLFTIFAPPVIDKFCLKIQANHYDEPRCWPIIDTWARQLRSRNVQHMKLYSFAGTRQSDYQLMCPPSVFRMHSLVTLELSFYANRVGWKLPNSIALPNLKKLSINKSNYVCYDEFDYTYLARLLSCCSSLEDLFLSLDLLQDKVVLITSTSLKRLCLDLNGRSIRDVIFDTPKLEQLDYCSNSLLSMQMLDSISSNVKSLWLSTGSMTRFNNCLTTLPELIRLDLSSLSSEICQAMIEQQMMHCPKLEDIVLSVSDYHERISNQEATFMLVQRVKRIELRANFNRFSKCMLNLVAWLLTSAKVLEKLVLHAPVPCWPDSYDNLVKSQFYQALFECVESTSRCQVKLLGAYELGLASNESNHYWSNRVVSGGCRGWK